MLEKLIGDLKSLGLVSNKGDNERKLFSPIDGEHFFSTKKLDAEDIALQVTAADFAQQKLEQTNVQTRQDFLLTLAKIVEDSQDLLAECILYDAGKVKPEGLLEAGNVTTIINKTINDASFADDNDIERRKKPIPAGTVTLITSYNFPLSVAGWTIAPAILAGNSVIWKPSGKTPLVAHAFKKLFDTAVHKFSNENISEDILQIADCDRNNAQALLTDPSIKVVSATGSVGMGLAISRALASRTDAYLSPLLELGGNNGVVVSEYLNDQEIEFAVSSILKSFLASTGQRCTNTRRVIVQQKTKPKFMAVLQEQIQKFIDSKAIRPANNTSHISHTSQGGEEALAHGYASLVDESSYQNFANAISAAKEHGATIHFGNRLMQDKYPNAYYTEPAIVECAEHYDLLDEEVFAPLLYVVEYSGDIAAAMELVNKPENAGLVNGIYTSNQKEIDFFIQHNQAGHGAINMDKGTGTPAHGMGFGGNKMSGTGEILSPNPLAPFCMGYNKFVINKNFTG